MLPWHHWYPYGCYRHGCDRRDSRSRLFPETGRTSFIAPRRAWKRSGERRIDQIRAPSEVRGDGWISRWGTVPTCLDRRRERATLTGVSVARRRRCLRQPRRAPDQFPEAAAAVRLCRLRRIGDAAAASPCRAAGGPQCGGPPLAGRAGSRCPTATSAPSAAQPSQSAASPACSRTRPPRIGASAAASPGQREHALVAAAQRGRGQLGDQGGVGRRVEHLAERPDQHGQRVEPGRCRRTRSARSRRPRSARPSASTCGAAARRGSAGARRAGRPRSARR